MKGNKITFSIRNEFLDDWDQCMELLDIDKDYVEFEEEMRLKDKRYENRDRILSLKISYLAKFYKQIKELLIMSNESIRRSIDESNEESVVNEVNEESEENVVSNNNVVGNNKETIDKDVEKTTEETIEKTIVYGEYNPNI